MFSESDLEKLGDILSVELPGTFRVCGMREDVMAFVNAQIGKLADELNSTLEDTTTTNPYLKKLEWYPGGMGWQVGTGRTELKKGENGVLNRLKQFLVSETAVGHISRQEAVSMIPPLFMDIKEYHRVLDMCAAPGSKTAQLIEALHRDAHEDYNPSSSAAPVADSHVYKHLVRGLVHANDASAKRCNTLITQTKRLDSPTLFVTQHDAQILPTLFYSPTSFLTERNETLYKSTKCLSPFDFEQKMTQMHIKPRTKSGNSSSASGNPTIESGNSASESGNRSDFFDPIPLLYDRILCDVPCSGDGTFRKNPDLWLKWRPTSGHTLHNVQVSILMRAIQLAAPCARIVYSTCSMNPVEDEAVILEVLRRSSKKLRLVDVSGVLPELKFRPGVASWTISDDEGNRYASFDQVPVELQKRLHESSFAPKDPEEASRAHIEYCMRFVPFDQDTGGFFVAVLELEDVSPTLSSAPSTPVAQSLEGDVAQEESGENGEVVEGGKDASVLGERKMRKQKYRKPQPTEFEKLDAPTAATVCPNLKSFFELSEDFPYDQLVKHSRGLHKLYLVSRANALLMDHDYLHRLKLKVTGVRAFENMTNPQGSECEYRITQDGVASLFPFLGPARIVNLSTNDVQRLLTAKDPIFDDFEEASRSKLTQMTVGSVVFSYHVNLGPTLPPYHLLLVGWRGKVSTQILIKPSEMPAITSAFNARQTE